MNADKFKYKEIKVMEFLVKKSVLIRVNPRLKKEKIRGNSDNADRHVSRKVAKAPRYKNNIAQLWAVNFKYFLRLCAFA